MHTSITNRKKFISFLILFLIGLHLQAQDLFFNQYMLAPLATNPAQTGTKQDSWVAINYRTIPLTSGEKINTSQFSVMHPVKLGDHRLVLSGSFYNDKISESFTTNGGIFGAALSLALSQRSELSFGTQASFFDTSLQENFTTDNQFINGVFDPSSPSGETINFTAGNNLSISSGLHWQLKDENENIKAFAGIALFNFTKPNVSVSDGEPDGLPVTYKATVGVEIYRQQNFAVSPSVLGISRSGRQWFQIGGLLTYDLTQEKDAVKQIGVGGWYNTNESVLLSLQYKQPELIVALNFDLPSGDGFATARKEAFEIAVHYRIFKKKSKRTGKFADASLNNKENNEVFSSEKTTEIVEVVSTPVKKEITEITDQGNENPTIKETSVKPEIKETTTAPLTLTDEELKIIGKHVRFEINSEILTSNSQTHLLRVAKIFNKYGHYDIKLIGHTCSLGSQEINEELSVQRADKVKEFLTKAGVSPNRITTHGRGEQEPLIENADENSRRINRRVEVKIADPKINH